MNQTKCPHCGNRLGNFYYADACPHCHHELLHNTRPLVSVAATHTRTHTAWPFGLVRQIIRLIES